MTLKDLRDQMNEEIEVIFQVVFGDVCDWDYFETVHCESPLLDPFNGCKIRDLTAIEHNVFRFEIVAEETK